MKLAPAPVRIRALVGWAAGLALMLALGLHWLNFFRERAAENAGGVRLVVFGPSGWDTLMPGAPGELSDHVVATLDRKFRAQHPDVGAVVHDSRGTVADGVARLRNAHVAGDQVDVVVCAANPVNTSYARLGLIEPMTAFTAGLANRFTPDSIENFRVNGEVWAAPLSVVNISTFFYNRDLFDRLGVKPPANDAEFRGIAAKLAAAGVIPIVQQGKNAWMWTPWYYSALVQTTGGQHRAYLSALLDGRARFTDPAGIAALRLTRRWMDEDILDPQSSELDEEGMKAAFLAGRAATFLGGTWDMPGIRANARFGWGVFPYPKLTGAPGRPLSFGGAEMGLCIAKGSRHPDLASAYIEFLTRPEHARLLLLPQQPFATSAPSVEGVSGPVADALRRQLPAEKPLEWMMPPEINEMMQRSLQAMMSGAASPDETAAAMQARMDAYRASQGSAAR